MTARTAGVDMRGFRSPLAALERKHGHELDRMRADLAVLECEAIALERAREDLARERGAQLQCAAALLTGGVDPRAYRHSLGYLSTMERQVEERSRQAKLLQARMAAARQACVDAHRRLASLRALREAAQATYARGQSRRDAREADLAWLVRFSRVRVEASQLEAAR